MKNVYEIVGIIVFFACLILLWCVFYYLIRKYDREKAEYVRKYINGTITADALITKYPELANALLASGNYTSIPSFESAHTKL